MGFKENLKQIRKSKKMTQKELADKSELSFSMVSKLETGEQKNPTLTTLEKIAKTLEVTTEELLGLSEPVPILDKIKKGFPNAAVTQTEGKISFQLVGSPDSEKRENILRMYDALNPAGQGKAYEYLQDLTTIPHYKKADHSDVGDT